MIEAVKRAYSSRQEAWNLFGTLLAAILLFGFVVAAEFNVGVFLIVLFSGLLLATLLFLVAAGLSLIFGLMDILNFAHGQFFMVGAYIAFDVQHPNIGVISFGESISNPELRFIIGIILATALGAVLGFLLERVLLRPMYARPLFQLVLTFGVSLVMLEAVKAVYDETAKIWSEDIFLTARGASFEYFGTDFSWYRVFLIVIGLLLVVGITLLIQRTRLGIIIRAGVEDPEMVSALGINVRAVFTLVFTLGCAVAAFGGAIAVPFQNASITLGSSFLIAAIAAIVLGGLGSFEGTALGCLLVGLTWSTMQQYSVATNVTVWYTITPMLMLIVVLLIRPRGLFGEER